jgi:ubiquinone/menaquinone biosynthesis C-methylase UbiE
MRTSKELAMSYLQEQKCFWNADEQKSRFGRVDTVSKTEAEYNRAADKDFEKVFSDVRTDPNSTILEIGCGVGRLLSRLLCRRKTGKVIGVDISDSMIQYARNALGARDDLILAVNSGADLSIIPDGSIDVAYSNDVFIHIDDVEVVGSYFNEVRRVLKPSGLFKFNVRRMELEKMFSNSPGGLLAKVLYTVGAWSPINATGQPSAGFNGIQYRERDLRRLIRTARMDIVTVVHIRAAVGPDLHGRIWCTCRPRRNSVLSR